MLAACVLYGSRAVAQAPPGSFYEELRAAVLAGDRAAVASRIRFPVTVGIGGVRVPFADSAALFERFDEIFTPELLEEMTRQVTVQQIGGAWRITGISVPAPSPDAPDAPRGADSNGPTRIGIRGGPRPTRVPGTLLPGGTDVYLLLVPKGRLLEVRLERVQGRAALLRVVHARTGAPLNPRIAGEARVVTGVASASADYRIEVRRGGGGDAAPLPYMLALTLR